MGSKQPDGPNGFVLDDMVRPAFEPRVGHHPDTWAGTAQSNYFTGQNGLCLIVYVPDRAMLVMSVPDQAMLPIWPRVVGIAE